MKKIFLSVAAFATFSSAIAGGLLTNTNQNISYLRNMARDASTEIDAVYSNPAGLAFIEDGFHVSLNVQSAFQTRTIVSTFAPFQFNGGSPTKTYEGEASAPFIPSLQAAYKKGKWAFSGSFAVTGGGGKATFNSGLPSFESQIAMIPVAINQLAGAYTGGLPAVSQYSVDSYMEGSQFLYGLQLGATYKITDKFSAFVGGRMNYASNNYVGYLRNIKINPNIPALGLNGGMIPATTFFNTLANMPGMDAAAGYADLVADKELECDQTGWGLTPIIGLDFKTGKFNFGLKYEFNTHLNIENKTKRDDTGLFQDGVNTPSDVPGLLTVGAGYEILPVLRASAGFHYFFDKQAKMANNKQDYLDHGTYEAMVGVEWDITKWFLISGSVLTTQYGVTNEFQQDLSFSLSSFSYGFGAAFTLTKDLKVNIAYFFTDYDDYVKESANYNGTGASGIDVFKRTNKVFGLGVNYRF